MNKALRNFIKYAASFLLAAILLALAFRGVSWKDFAASLVGADWKYMALFLLCSVGAFVLRALRWKMLLGPIDPSMKFSTVFDGVCIGNLANCALPFLGEFVRAGSISKHRPEARYDKVLGTIVLERCWDLVAIVVIVLAVIVSDWSVFGTFFSEKVVMAAAGGVTTVKVAVAIAAVLLLAAAVFAVVRLKDRVRICARIYDAVAGIFQGIAACWKMDRKWLFVVYTLGIWLLYWGMCVSVALALSSTHSLTLADTLFIMAVGNFASVVPVPGGFGAYHYLVALTLSTLFGLSWESGLVFATLSHESQALSMIVFGIICLVHSSITNKKI